MFENLTERLSSSLAGLRGRQLTEENIRGAISDVRTSLLEADVALDVVLQFISDVQGKALGQTTSRNVQPGDFFIKVVHDSLVEIIGAQSAQLNLNTPKDPAVVLMAGLQGSGKTSSVAKLAKFIQEREKKRVGVVSADVYRPAAIEQLRVLVQDLDVQFMESSSDQKPVKIVQNAIKASRREGLEVLLIDTAGRLAIDEAMMNEISALHKTCDPTETLFVVDAMTGQDAANTAKAFNETLPLTGVILTKTDGDARGGAALSVNYITGKPLKFLGTGEGLDGWEVFHPDRIASRILGMGDVLSFIEEAERKVDSKKAQKLVKKLVRGTQFDLQDYRDQLDQFVNLGGINALQKMLPNANTSQFKMKEVDDAEFKRHAIIIDSMTAQERRYPALLDSSRKRRIANGSGTQIQDVNTLLRKFKQTQKQMRKVGRKGKLGRAMQQMQARGFDPNVLN